MIRIRFKDAAVERQALGFLVGRFSFKTWDTGETAVPEAALARLKEEGLPFTIVGPATYEHLIPSVRNPPAKAV
jgi:hypothetical protein